MAAAIQEISLPGYLGESKAFIIAQLWQWIHDHADDKIYTFKIYFISKTVYVRDCHPIFERILGTDPL